MFSTPLLGRYQDIPGGWYVLADTLLSGCLILGNTSGGAGGGFNIAATTPNRVTMSNCWILNNSAGTHAGGVYEAKRPALYTCLIAGNSAGTNSGNRGGGIHISSTLTGEVWNCTIAGNAAPAADGYGGGIWFAGYAHLVNSIVYDNSAGTSGSNWYRNSGTLYVTNSCIAPASGTGISGENITGEDPQYENPAAGNFRLGDGSPCINAGLTMDWMADARDLDGRARLDRFTRRVDMGAYERPLAGTLIQVK